MDLLSKANTDLLPISPRIPQIMLVIDEGAEIRASPDRQVRKLGEKILEVIRIARAMGVRTVLGARREGKVRVALTGGETEGMDLSKMFPGSRGLRVDQAPHKGAGFMAPRSPRPRCSRRGGSCRTRSATSPPPPPTDTPSWTTCPSRQQAALAALIAAGPAGTGASAIARALANAYGTTRQTVVGWLKTWMEDGTAVRVGEGTKARYVHRSHTRGEHLQPEAHGAEQRLPVRR